MSDTELTSFAESLSLKSSRNGFLEGISCKLYVFHFLRTMDPIQDFALLRRNPRICYRYDRRNYVHQKKKK